MGHRRRQDAGTHRNFYPGGDYVHLPAGMPGYQGNIYVIVHIRDPSAPVEPGRWWVPGQHVAAGETGNSAVSLHGPPHVARGYISITDKNQGLWVLRCTQA